MFDPNSDREDYGKLLAPPADFILDFAIGTTYSLDLDTLTGASIALGLSGETDSDLLKNPVYLLEALETIGDKTAIFCEAGQIHKPNTPTALYILLEKMVFEVIMPMKKGAARYPSFHPKFWLIKYISKDGDELYRVIVLSRNLTFDHSWDISFAMDGRRLNKFYKKNEPLQDFLGFLAKNIPDSENGKAKSKRIRDIANELSFVKFDLNSNVFTDYDFIPHGIKNQNGGIYSIKNNQLFWNYGDEIEIGGYNDVFIISPFISKKTIRYFTERNKRMGKGKAKQVLITREMSLPVLDKRDFKDYDVYVIKDSVIDGASEVSEGTGENNIEVLNNANEYMRQDIHAKVYMVRKNTETDLYLGSMNASENAINGNVEFMMGLYTQNRYLNMDKMKKDIFGEKEDSNPFRKVSATDVSLAQEEDTSELNGIIKALVRMAPRGKVRCVDNFYNISIHFDSFKESMIPIDAKISISPILSKKTLDINEDMTFEKLTLVQLSEFFTLTVSFKGKNAERVVVIPITGMPENREREVISSVVNEECFYRYIAFLLGDDYVLNAISANPELIRDSTASNNSFHYLPGLYEKMLKASAEDYAAERFDRIENLVKALKNKGTVPNGFESVYSVFRKAVNAK